jgi:hypothetical protein
VFETSLGYIANPVSKRQKQLKKPYEQKTKPKEP